MSAGRGEVHLRDHPGHRGGAVQYFPPHLPHAEEPSGHHPQGRGKSDGQGERPENLPYPGPGERSLKKPDERASSASPVSLIESTVRGKACLLQTPQYVKGRISCLDSARLISSKRGEAYEEDRSIGNGVTQMQPARGAS